MTSIGYASAARRGRGRLQLGRGLTLVADAGVSPHSAATASNSRPALVVSGLVDAGRDQLADPVPAPALDLRGEPFRQPRAFVVECRRPARRTPSATALAPRRRPRGAAPGAGSPPARIAPRPPTRSSPPHTVPSGPYPLPSKIAPTAGPGSAVLGQAGGEVGVVMLHRDAARPPRDPARRRSRGSPGAGRGRRPRARPRTGARSARRPPETSSASPSCAGPRCAGRPRRARRGRGRTCS